VLSGEACLARLLPPGLRDCPRAARGGPAESPSR